ncbi:hypothetical protein V8C42DRAFT_343913 [Trichoderma barbatum]
MGDKIMHIKDHVWENIDGRENRKRFGNFHDSGAAMIAISNDGRRAFSGSHYHGKIWIFTIGQKAIRLLIGPIFEMAFGSRESYIATSRGYIDVNNLDTGDETPDSYKTVSSDQILFEGYGLSADKNCITWNRANILWLQVAYRPASDRNSITMFPLSIFLATGLSNVMIIKFSVPPPA